MKKKAIAVFLLLIAAFVLADDSTLTTTTSETTTTSTDSSTSTYNIVSTITTPTPTASECTCTTEYYPVCGSDGITYLNPCMAKCAGVTAFTEGKCITITPTATISVSIPPIITATPTPSVEANATISCSSCPNIIDYVCGIDGNTYLNYCFAECKQIYYSPGRCVGLTTPTPTVVTVPTTVPTPTPSNEMCICTLEYAPVCGSNGKTYSNACSAKCEGITAFTNGECKTTITPTPSTAPVSPTTIGQITVNTTTVISTVKTTATPNAQITASSSTNAATTTQLVISSETRFSSQITVTANSKTKTISVSPQEKISFIQREGKTIIEMPKSIQEITSEKPTASKPVVEKIIQDNSSGIKIIERRSLSQENNKTTIVNSELDIPVKANGTETGVIFVQASKTIKSVERTPGTFTQQTENETETIVNKVELVTKEQTLSSTDETLAGSTAQLRVALNTVPQDSTMAVTTRQATSDSEKKTFEKIAADNNKTIIQTAFFLDVKTDLKKEVENATIIFKINKKWVEANGGKEKINLLRESGGKTELLITKFFTTDQNSNYVFRAFSPNGLSVYAIVLLESVEETPQESYSSMTKTTKTTPSPTIELRGGFLGLSGNELTIFSIILVLAMAALIIGLYMASLRKKA